MGKSLVEIAANLVQAQCATRAMNAEELATALRTAFNALRSLELDEERLKAANPGEEKAAETSCAAEKNPAKSIQKNKIICLECSREFRAISFKHLQSHGLTAREYRSKWGFSLKQPLCARVLTENRRKAAKERGLPENLRAAIARRKKNAEEILPAVEA